ncbi:hypothetical protein GH733_006791 [Mirounga leonina]|nr:hypothetical protein GH733_006791 [Mirounga leonina]
MAAVAAAAVAEGASMSAVPVSGADSNGESPEVEGEGVGAVGEEKDAATKGAEAVGDSEEDGEDVFEVEKILDMKTEGRLSLNNDIFEANSDSDQQSETKEDTSPKKKKKKLRHREEKSPDDMKKKKAKTGKLKDKSKPDLESSSESLVFDLRTKKRISEAKEELKESKKPKKEDTKETKELKKVKKGEIRDLKNKLREDSKENRKTKKEKCVESQLEAESSILNESSFQENDNEDLHLDNREEKQKIKSVKDKVGQDAVQDVFDKQPDGFLSADEDADVKAKRKRKKLRKTEELKESKTLENRNLFLEKKTIYKKQRNQDKGKSTTELDKLPPAPVQTQKSSRAGLEERGLWSPDSGGEEKEIKKNEPKEKNQKRHDLDKEEKGRKEPKGLKTFKEIRNAFDLLKLTPEEKTEFPENNRKREEILDCKITEDHKTKENKQLLKERRNTRDETDTWAYIAAEGDQEVLDSMCQADENSDGRQQILSLGMDLQLEWMKLEDFQKHLDGEDENFTTADAIPSNLLRDAVKNGDYIAVKVALNSNEEYNLDQEACKRGNSDIVRLVIECGADCNILSKHQNSALHFAKQCNNVLVYDLLKNHLETLSRVAEETIRDYFEARLALLEPVFPIACHRLCEGPDFSTDFNYKPPQNIPEGSGILLFIFHANFLGKEVIARLCGPCSVQAVVLNDKFQLPVFLDSHFVYSFSPAAGLNKLFIRLTEAPSAKVKILSSHLVQLLLLLRQITLSSAEKHSKNAVFLACLSWRQVLSGIAVHQNLQMC